MSSYSDYIASKRVFTVTNGAYGNCNAPCMMSYGPLYDGGIATGCSQNSGESCCAGPTGPPGDKYLSYFTESFYQNVFFTNCTIAIKIDIDLAYLPGMLVKFQSVPLPNEVDTFYFYGVINSYDKIIGVAVVSAINRISINFPYGIAHQFSINIDNTGPTGPTGPMQALEDDIVVNNSITFSSAPSGVKLQYGTIGSTGGFVLNDNLRVNALYFTSSGNSNISHDGTDFTINDSVDISGNCVVSGNVSLGTTTGAYSAINTRLPQNSATSDSYAVRMAFNNSLTPLTQWQLFASTSTAKQKANITTLPDTTSILDVRPVTYNPISSSTGELQSTHIGFIAEEMAENDLGNYFVIHDENGSPKSIQYDLIIPLYASAMRSLRTRITELENIVKLQGEKLSKIEEFMNK